MKFPLSWLIITFNLVIINCSNDYFVIDKSDWLEPSSMFEDREPTRFDQKDESTQTSNTCECTTDPGKVVQDCSSIAKELDSCNKEIKTLRTMLNSKSCSYRASAFFRRIALKTVSKIDQLMVHSQNLDTSSGLYLHVDVSAKDMSILQELKLEQAIEECYFIEKVDKVASRLIDSSYLGSKPSFWVEHHDYIVGTIIAICIGYAFIIRRGYIDKLILFLIVGTLWEWKRMYQMEIAKRLESSLVFPPECNGGKEVEWTRSLANWITGVAGNIFSFKVHAQTSDGVCSSYYSSIAVNPILDVNPVEAFSHILGLIFFRPLVQLGDYSGKATTKFFAHIPIAYLPLILPSALFVIALVIMGIFRYSLKLPFVKISPSSSPQTITHIHHTSGHPVDSGDRPPFLPPSHPSSPARIIVSPPQPRRSRSPYRQLFEERRDPKTLPRSHSLGDVISLVRRRKV